MVKFVQTYSETSDQNLLGTLEEGRPRALLKSSYLASFLLILTFDGGKIRLFIQPPPQGETLQAVRIGPWKSNFENDISQTD